MSLTDDSDLSQIFSYTLSNVSMDNQGANSSVTVKRVKNIPHVVMLLFFASLNANFVKCTLSFPRHSCQTVTLEVENSL